MKHLRIAASDGDPAPSRRAPQWLVRVYQGTTAQPTGVILSEGIVDSRSEAIAYARATYAATGRLAADTTTLIWATLTPGTLAANHWVPAGGTCHAQFDPAGQLGPWHDGHEPRQ